jgi:hypothetical protein
MDIALIFLAGSGVFMPEFFLLARVLLAIQGLSCGSG